MSKKYTVDELKSCEFYKRLPADKQAELVEVAANIERMVSQCAMREKPAHLFSYNPYTKNVCSCCKKTTTISKRTRRCVDCQTERTKDLKQERQKRVRAVDSAYRYGKFVCAYCKKKLTPQRSTAKFCCAKCRVYFHRQAAVFQE